MRADLAWEHCQAGGSLGDGITVAVIDSGIDYRHEEITGNVWLNPNDPPGDVDGDGDSDDDANGFVDDFQGWNFVDRDNDPADNHGHGTRVAGIAVGLGSNGTGISGLPWTSKVMVPRVSRASGRAEAILYAADNGADLLNLSWRMTASSYAVETALRYAYYGEAGNGGGCVVVAAAGNDAEDASSYFPQQMRETILVSNFDRFDEKVDSSNHGAGIDVAAPGDGRYYLARGRNDCTRFATLTYCPVRLRPRSSVVPDLSSISGFSLRRFLHRPG
jgi:subtilisin family serine protease